MQLRVGSQQCLHCSSGPAACHACFLQLYLLLTVLLAQLLHCTIQSCQTLLQMVRFAMCLQHIRRDHNQGVSWLRLCIIAGQLDQHAGSGAG
jgi:hypothetical protein